MEINGTEAVVTGAAGGLGGAIARNLHAHGARLILTDRREEGLQSLASQLNGAEIVVCDLADGGQVAALTARLTDTDIVVATRRYPRPGSLMTSLRRS